MSLCWSSEAGEAFKTLKQPLVLQEEGNKDIVCHAGSQASRRETKTEGCSSHHSHLPPTGELTTAARGHQLTVQPPLLCGSCPQNVYLLFVF